MFLPRILGDLQYAGGTGPLDPSLDRWLHSLCLDQFATVEELICLEFLRGVFYCTVISTQTNTAWVLSHQQQPVQVRISFPSAVEGSSFVLQFVATFCFTSGHTHTWERLQRGGFCFYFQLAVQLFGGPYYFDWIWVMEERHLAKGCRRWDLVEVRCSFFPKPEVD